MHTFALPLEKGEDPMTGLPAFGFTINGMLITAPFRSECCQFEVDPTEAYGLSEKDAVELENLNQVLTDATTDALNAGCLAIQTALGIATGDVAAVHFSGSAQTKPIAQALMDYILTEYNMNREADA